MRYICFIFGLLLTASLAAGATDAYRTYIDNYADMAVAERKAHGIPASITLAQGLLESAAGRSRLAREGNNHFGIKCHQEWKGDTMLRNDDAANECFRVYDDVAQSFADHSRFLLKKRYAPLFEFAPDDYISWAHGLRKCGYATDPNYAVRLIAIIEKYSLNLYDSDAERPEEMAEYIATHLKASHPVRRSRGLLYVIATPGDTYSSIAKELHMDLKQLLALNDADHDGRIKDWEEVYLMEKHTTAPEGLRWITIGDGESLHSIAQRMGMKISALRELNPEGRDIEGTRLRLR